ncbi:MAG: hypothetical protein CMD27_02425 [Flavobacteriales bacterium]|nr:hypothetical protein [Flavobacteriales bacterium]
MMKKIIYLFAFCVFFDAAAQKMEITSAVIALDNHKDLEAAQKWIDIATDKINAGGTLKPKILSKYNHYQGLIYLKKFQADNENEISFNYLEIASNAFLKDAVANASFSKKSNNQLPVCAYLYQEGAYKDYENKDYKSAFSKFVSAISINTSEAIQKIDTFNMYNASLMAFQSGDYEESVKWSNELINLDSTDVRFHTRLIAGYEELGNLDLQLEAIKQARSYVPQSKEIIFSEVNYYLTTGDSELLLESLDNAVKSDSLNPILHLVLGNTYNQLGDFEKSKSSFENAIALDSTYFDAYNNLASLYLDQTIDLIEKKNALSFKQSKLDASYKKQIDNLYKQALPHLESCFNLDSENLAIISVLKEIYYKLNNSEKSLEMKRLEASLKSK